MSENSLHQRLKAACQFRAFATILSGALVFLAPTCQLQEYSTIFCPLGTCGIHIQMQASTHILTIKHIFKKWWTQYIKKEREEEGERERKGEPLSNSRKRIKVKEVKDPLPFHCPWTRNLSWGYQSHITVMIPKLVTQNRVLPASKHLHSKGLWMWVKWIPCHSLKLLFSSVSSFSKKGPQPEQVHGVYIRIYLQLLQIIWFFPSLLTYLSTLLSSRKLVPLSHSQLPLIHKSTFNWSDHTEVNLGPLFFLKIHWALFTAPSKWGVSTDALHWPPTSISPNLFSLR